MAESVGLYQIIGSFYQKADGVDMDFNGYFASPKGDERIFGMLNDPFGKSCINGLYQPELGKLDFTKKYQSSLSPINYIFRRDNGLWVGRYFIIESRHPISDATSCSISLHRGESELIIERLMHFYLNPQTRKQLGIA